MVIARDAVDNYLWLNLVLTLLAWLPGALHAAWVVLVVKQGSQDSYEPLLV